MTAEHDELIAELRQVAESHSGASGLPKEHFVTWRAADALAARHAADREALTVRLSGVRIRFNTASWPMGWTNAKAVVDALLGPDGPLLEVRTVEAKALRDAADVTDPVRFIPDHIELGWSPARWLRDRADRIERGES